MKKKIVIMSIPHTGTVFTQYYLEQVMPLKHYEWHETFLNHQSKHVFSKIHLSSEQRKENEEIRDKYYDFMGYAENNCKVIVPLRSPMDNAISYIARYQGIHYLRDNWTQLIQLPMKYDVFFLDINISKVKRANMMHQLNAFIERKPDPIKFCRYIDQWKPVNVHKENRNPIKSAYEERGELPKGHNFNNLTFAVQWYKKKKAELEKQYSRP